MNQSRGSVTTLLLIAALAVSCRVGPDEATIRINQELVGSWRQILEGEGEPRPTTVRHFFLEPDGNLRVDVRTVYNEMLEDYLFTALRP